MTFYSECINQIKKHLLISYDKDLIIDPHAGNDTFMDGIQTLARLSLFYNKNPLHENVMPLDFLQLDFDKYNKTFLSGLWFDDVHIISQPPKEQAEQFIEAACKFAQSISLIIPKKAQTAFPINYQRMFSQDLPEKGMVFQIWLKADC
jgi:hypothetical protein